MKKLDVTKMGSGWYVWTVPDHQIISRRFALQGEAEIELIRLEKLRLGYLRAVRSKVDPNVSNT